jgi:hypothetical protein
MRRGLIAIALSLVANAAMAQQGYRPPRDVYGHPSLEGVWTARWLTTLQRPASIDRLALTEAEAAAWLPPVMDARAKNEVFDEETAVPDAKTLAIVRGQHRTSLIVDPPDGKLPLTPAGREAYALPPQTADGPESRGLGERCIAGPSRAGMLIAPAGMLHQIVQTRDHVVLHSEAFDEIRILAPASGRQPADIGSWYAAAVARWERDTFVVETTGFRPDDKMRGVPFSRFPLRPQTKVTERFTRIGPDELLYEFTVEDPVLYSAVWRAEYVWRRTIERAFEFACHEGNYGLANILSGARQEERRARAGAGR